jgi:hypothetical protein
LPYWRLVHIAGGSIGGLLGWLTCWTLLARVPWGERLAYLVAGVAVMSMVLAVGQHSVGLGWTRFFGALCGFGHVAIGLAIPLMMLRRRRWRFVRQGCHFSGRVERSAKPQQFSIAELLTITAVSGVFCLGVSTPWDLLHDCAVVTGIVLTMTLVMSCQRPVIAATFAISVSTAIYAAAMYLMFHLEGVSSNWPGIGGQLGCPLAFVAFHRCVGYRLARVN